MRRLSLRTPGLVAASGFLVASGILGPSSGAARGAAPRVSPKARTAPSATISVAPPAMSGSVPPYVVATRTIRLFDPSRSTAARGSMPAVSGRLLVTEISAPVGASGPRPLVVFAHGWDSDPGVYASLLDEWAAAGFIVAAPVFPDTTDLYPGSPAISDYADQALDVSFVITSLLHDPALPVDPTRIAVAGHSDGATDVALMALDPSYGDPRVRAYVSLSGELPTGVPTFDVTASRAALLVAVGSDDEYGLYPKSTTVFQAANTAAKVMLVEPGGDHLGSFVGGTPAAGSMRSALTQFLELALEPRTPSSSGLAGALAPAVPPLLRIVPSS